MTPRGEFHLEREEGTSGTNGTCTRKQKSRSREGFEKGPRCHGVGSVLFWDCEQVIDTCIAIACERFNKKFRQRYLCDIVKAFPLTVRIF